MNTPVVRVFDTLTPANAGSGDFLLQYPGLQSRLDELSKSNPAREHEVWNAQADSPQEEMAARELAYEYFVKGAGKMVLAPNIKLRSLWAERYNQAASELYELPERSTVIGLMVRHRDEVKSALLGKTLEPSSATELLLGTYDKLLPKGEETEDAVLEEVHIARALEDYKQELNSRYGDIFKLVEASGKKHFGPSDLKELFEDTLNTLVKNGEPGWSEWQVVFKDSKILSVNSPKREIEVGSRRPTASAAKINELLAHELFVHALRANNAYVAGNEMLAKGLSGFADFEEGMGKFAEHAISGIKPPTSADHYVDIGLALGVVNGEQLNRHQVYELAIARKIVRAQMAGTYHTTKLSSLIEQTASSVDRIFYGAPGDNLPATQAVFIKETGYYGGYHKVLQYIVEAQAEGKSMREIFDYLTQGRFNPTDAKHIEYVKEHGNE